MSPNFFLSRWTFLFMNALFYSARVSERGERWVVKEPGEHFVFWRKQMLLEAKDKFSMSVYMHTPGSRGLYYFLL